MLPLYFQGVLLDSATKAGIRLIVPSLAAPLGGLVAGVVMSRWGQLLWIVRAGAASMVIGNALTSSLGMKEPSWKYILYIFPANFGQGMVYPGILFTSLASFEHAGMLSSLSPCGCDSIEADAPTKIMPCLHRLRISSGLSEASGVWPSRPQ
jgi:hypothetical protein